MLFEHDFGTSFLQFEQNLRSEVIHTIVIFKYSRTSELRVPWGNKGIYKSEISVTLKLQAYLTILCGSPYFSSKTQHYSDFMVILTKI